ncbi:MAG TPA: MMPL family transporter [Bacteroidia bacterium]|nr:MMPL family transporter [Bacteroidia bacterium]HNT81547.1 MMPL family transporter [Bacteroidia bacterium]
MWKFLANKVLRNRPAFLFGLVLLTVFMGYKATNIKLSYHFASLLPATDSSFVQYERFKKLFGEDGSVMVIGLADSSIFRIEKFNDWYLLSKKIKKIDGIQNVLSLGDVYDLVRNDSLRKFDFVPLVKSLPQQQSEIDSIRKRLDELPFYDGLVLNKETNATLMAITFKKKDLDSKHRIDIVNEIKKEADAFSRLHNIELHFSGMPYIRTAVMEKVSHELKLFLILAVIMTTIILGAFFRSISSVVISVIVVAIGVLWSIGSIELLNYKITILTALIPPLIMVIGVPNCIFLINKYHSEYAHHGNKVKALARMITTIGVSLFLANITTAIGFGVLVFTKSSFLAQFGVIAALNVMATYFITLILIPVVLSYMAPPSVKNMRHLEGKRIRKVLEWVDYIVHHKRNAIYLVITLVTLLCVYGMSRIDVTGYVVDDLPKNNPVYNDMHFFEKNFKGVLPFEVFINTRKPDGVLADNARVLYKMKSLEKILEQYPELSRGISIVDALKFSYQAYRGGDPKYYVLPGISELKNLNDYATTVKGNENRLKSFIDSTKQYTRISMQMADVGSKKIKKLLAEIQPRVDSIFSKDEYDVKLTGHSLMFLKGNDYLLYNLYESLIIEIVLIALVGMALFREVRIILLSKLPCLIPLIITAGIMGFLDIRFKPSTILIFSIAFGISSDGTVYFLAKYKRELKYSKSSISDAISATIMDTGFSMIYTAIILFFGFSIFAASDFGGTVALGVLISITLLVAMITNLVLLPSLLLSIDKWVSRKQIIGESLIELDDEDDEE